MAGFGIRAFKKVQDDESHKSKREYFQHIVYGENYFAVLTYLKLLKRFGSDKVKLISESPITYEDSLLMKKILEKIKKLG